jgi:hypothetical protein
VGKSRDTASPRDQPGRCRGPESTPVRTIAHAIARKPRSTSGAGNRGAAVFSAAFRAKRKRGTTLRITYSVYSPFVPGREWGTTRGPEWPSQARYVAWRGERTARAAGAHLRRARPKERAPTRALDPSRASMLAAVNVATSIFGDAYSSNGARSVNHLLAR